MAATDLLRDYDDVVEHYRAKLASVLESSSADESGPRESVIVERPSSAPPAEPLRALAANQAALRGRIQWAFADLDRLPQDPSCRAALGTVAARLSDVSDVHDSLEEMIAALRTSAAGPAATSPSVMYLEGVQRWALAATDELSSLAFDLVDMRADWPRFRQQLAFAKSEWPTELVEGARRELEGLDEGSSSQELTTTFEELSFALRVLSDNLEQRFG